MKKNITAASIFALSLAADIATKAAVVSRLSFFDRVDFLGGFVRLTLVYNEGGVFGILQGYKTLFLIISLFVLVIMVLYYIYEKNKTMMFCAAMAMIAAGAVGNIIDRLIADRPGVVDFISIGIDNIYRWPTFNIADTCIVIGAAMLIVVFYKDEKRRRLNKNKAEE